MPEKKTVEKHKDFESKFGNKYKFQRVGAAHWLDIMDDAEDENTGRPKRSKLYPVILEHIVVSPTMTLEDFDKEGYGGTGELEEVVSAATRFQQGKQ